MPSQVYFVPLMQYLCVWSPRLFYKQVESGAVGARWSDGSSLLSYRCAKKCVCVCMCHALSSHLSYLLICRRKDDLFYIQLVYDKTNKEIIFLLLFCFDQTSFKKVPFLNNYSDIHREQWRENVCLSKTNPDISFHKPYCTITEFTFSSGNIATEGYSRLQHFWESNRRETTYLCFMF